MEYVVLRNKKFPLNQDFSLNLSSQEIEELQEIQGLEDLKTIKSLYLDNNKIKDIQSLSKLKKLKVLSLKNNKIENIESIGTLKELNVLYLSRNNIEEIKGLELPNLKYLFIESSNLTKMDGLKDIYNLEKLWLNDNKIVKIEGLEKLEKLENLILSKNQIVEISGLDNLVELKVLDLSENQIIEISGLQNLENLEKIKLIPNPIPRELWDKFETDRYYPNKAQIYVKYCRKEYVEYGEKFYFIDNNKLHLSSLGIFDLNDVKGFENISDIEFLNLTDNPIEEINNLHNLKNLKTLWLSFNKIREIKNLENLTKLEKLALNDNCIKHISGLESLRELKELNLSSNSIRDLYGLNSLNNINTLDLSNNSEIKNFSGLENLTSLKELILINTNISNLSLLRNMKDLKKLVLSNNIITKIPKINIPNLKWLDLSNNYLEDMENFCQFPNLEYLNLDNNKIDELKCIDLMLNNLIKFYIENNKLNKSLYDKLKIADKPNNYTFNNSRFFILYLLLKSFFTSSKDREQLEIDLKQLIKDSNIVHNFDYAKLRDIVKIFNESYEIRCGPNELPLSIVTPKGIAKEIDEKILKFLVPGKKYPLNDLVTELHLCNKKAAKRLLRQIRDEKFTKKPFTFTTDNIIRAPYDVKEGGKIQDDIHHIKSDIISTIERTLKKINYRFIEDMNIGGGSGRLYKINSVVDEKTRVLKLYFDPVKNSNRSIFLEDVKKLKRFDHENIVEAFDTGYIDFENETYFYIILEYIEGYSFDKIEPHVFWENNTFNERSNLFKELLKTIEFFRRQYQFHNDLHSGNLMLISKNGLKSIKLIDFGTSKDKYGPAEPDYDLYMLKNEILRIFFKPEELESFSREKIDKSKDFNEFKQIFVSKETKMQVNGEEIRIKEILEQCYEGIKKICDFYYQKLEHSRNPQYEITLNDNEVFLSVKKIEKHKDICFEYLEVYYEAKNDPIKQIGSSNFKIIHKDLTINVFLKDGRFPLNSFYLIKTGEREHMEKSMTYRILGGLKERLDNIK